MRKALLNLTISVTHTYRLTQLSVPFNTHQRQRKSTFKSLLWSKHAARTVAVRTKDYRSSHYFCVLQIVHTLYRTHSHTQHTSTLTQHEHIWLAGLKLSLSWLFLGHCYPFSRRIQQTLQMSVTVQSDWMQVFVWIWAESFVKQSTPASPNLGPITIIGKIPCGVLVWMCVPIQFSVCGIYH